MTAGRSDVCAGLWLYLPGLGVIEGKTLVWGRVCDGDTKCRRRAAVGCDTCWRHSGRRGNGRGFIEHDTKVDRGRMYVGLALLPRAVEVLGACEAPPEAVWSVHALLDVWEAMGRCTSRTSSGAERGLVRVRRLQPQLEQMNFPGQVVRRGIRRGEPSSREVVRAVHATLLAARLLGGVSEDAEGV